MIVRSVARSGESLVIYDVTLESRAEGRIVEDEYIRAKNPRSILCMPVLHQDKVQGVLYLARFVGEDERGQKLPVYMEQLCDVLEEEKRGIGKKLERLTKSLDRIKEVIRLQQSYAGTTLLNEELSLADVVWDAMAINGAEYEELGIEVKREFSEIKPIMSDRHRLMLILMNLLSNARDAFPENGSRESVGKQIRLIIKEAGRGRVLICVEDNGEGIGSQNLDKVFRSGYSTRRNRQGFGLHNSANAAAELGGKIRVESGGPDRGTSFELELPDGQDRPRV